MSNDRELWDDFRNGNKNALSQIYHDHISSLYSFGKKLTKDEDMIKDSIQDLFFDLIRTRKNLNGTDNIRFYLLASLKRKLIRCLNKKKQKRQVSEENVMIFFGGIALSPEKEFVIKEEISRNEFLLNKALGTLSLKQKEILHLRYTCGLDYDEICKIMSIKYNSARKTVFRALKSLRENLEKSDFED